MVRDAAGSAGPGELTAAIKYPVPVLARAGGVFAKAALLAGALVEWGGSALPLSEVLPVRAVAAMEAWSLFPQAWAEASGRRARPDPADLAVMPHAREALTRLARRRGLPQDGAVQLAASWFDTAADAAGRAAAGHTIYSVPQPGHTAWPWRQDRTASRLK